MQVEELKEADLREGVSEEASNAIEGPDDEELDLEAEVFGSLGIAKSTLDSTADVGGEDEDLEEESDSAPAGFFINRKPTAVEERKQEAAWVDEDDEQVEVDLSSQNRLRKLRQAQSETVVSGREYSQRLREQHRKLHSGATGWTRKRRRRATTDDQAEETALLQSNEPLVASAESVFSSLPAGPLDIKRLNDANQHGVSSSVVQSVDWHKDAMLMLTAGYDKSLRIFHVDGKENRKFHSVYLQDMPIR